MTRSQGRTNTAELLPDRAGIKLETGRLPLLRSVRGKLIVTITLFIAVTAGALSFADYRYVRNLLRTSTEQQMMLRAEGLSEVIQAFAGQQLERVSLVASRTRLRELTSARLDGGLEPAEYEKATHRILVDAQVSTRGFESIRLADPAGTVLTATDPALNGSSVAGDAVFDAALVSATLGLPVAAQGRYTASLGAPAVSGDGRLLGVVLVALDVAEMRELLTHIPTTFETATVRVAARVDGELRYLFGDGAGVDDVNMRRALAGESGYSALEQPDGRTVLAAFRPVGYGGWGLVAEVDEDEAYEPILELRGVLVGIAIVVGILGAIVGVRIAANLTRPILRLANVAGQIGNGDLSVRARVGGNDEVGIMARSFNLMTGQLEKHQNNLMELVSERTQALQERSHQLELANEQLAALCELLETQAETLEQDLQRAEMIQRSMLPQTPPAVRGLSLRTLYRPGHNVGGDLFEAVAVRERYLVLVVADASGHGVSAALLAFLFRHRLNVVDEATGEPLDPADALTSMNTLLAGDIKAPGVFFTCVYCVIDVESKTLRMAAAGHPPLVRLNTRGEIDLLPHTGPALGLDADASYSERTAQLETGDRLLLYTDGILDAAGEHTPDAREIGEAFAAIEPGPTELEELLAGMTGETEREDRDDVTLLTLQVAEGESFFDVSESATGTGIVDSGDTELSWADVEGLRWFVLRGRVTWTFGETLLTSATEAIAAGQGVRVDLAQCEYLDSTMFGTLHEVVERAGEADCPAGIQATPKTIEAAVRELSMELVLAAMRVDTLPLPGTLARLSIHPSDLKHQRERLLRAHEVLMDLSEGNRAEFSGVVDALRADADIEDEHEETVEGEADR